MIPKLRYNIYGKLSGIIDIWTEKQFNINYKFKNGVINPIIFVRCLCDRVLIVNLDKKEISSKHNSYLPFNIVKDKFMELGPLPTHFLHLIEESINEYLEYSGIKMSDFKSIYLETIKHLKKIQNLDNNLRQFKNKMSKVDTFYDIKFKF